MLLLIGFRFPTSRGMPNIYGLTGPTPGKTEEDQPIAWSNERSGWEQVNKAWWQQAEMMLALTNFFTDHVREHVYSGVSGYFKSLGDWSQSFATGPDFRVEIVDESPKKVVARIHGTLYFKTPINGLTELNDNQHAWTEIFHLSAEGRIETLEVQMNLKMGNDTE